MTDMQDWEDARDARGKNCCADCSYFDERNEYCEKNGKNTVAEAEQCIYFTQDEEEDAE